MNGSSRKSTSAFDGLTLQRALALVDALETSKLRTKKQIESVFSKSSQRFDLALAFLIRVGVVREVDDVLVLRKEPPAEATSDRGEWLLSGILRVRNRYRSEVCRFLRNFRLEEGDLVYRSPVHNRSRESRVRNFLMELGIIKYDRERVCYIVSREYVSLYANAIEQRFPVSPETLSRTISERDELGFSAEKMVMDFEQQRLGPQLAKEVDHISQRNVAAGYDIRSLTITDGKQVVPRYIEVKAVSADSMRFYWTRNEVSVARSLKEAYFLYLLPVRAEGGFDLSFLKIIPDPHNAVLASPVEWLVEPDVIRCSLRRQRKGSQKSGVLHHV